MTRSRSVRAVVLTLLMVVSTGIAGVGTATDGRTTVSTGESALAIAAVDQSDIVPEDETADELYVLPDGRVALVIVEDGTGETGSVESLLVLNVSERLAYLLLGVEAEGELPVPDGGELPGVDTELPVTDVEVSPVGRAAVSGHVLGDSLQATGWAVAPLGLPGLAYEGHLTGERSRERHTIEFDASGEVDPETWLVIAEDAELGDAPSDIEIESGTAELVTAGDIVVTSDRVRATGDLTAAVDGSLVVPDAEAEDLPEFESGFLVESGFAREFGLATGEVFAVEITESDDGFVVVGHVQFAPTGTSADHWDTEAEAAATLAEMFGPTAESLGGSATVTLDGYSFEAFDGEDANANGATGVVDVYYTAELEGVRAGVDRELARSLAETAPFVEEAPTPERLAKIERAVGRLQIERVALSLSITSDGSIDGTTWSFEDRVSVSFEVDVRGYQPLLFVDYGVTEALEDDLGRSLAAETALLSQYAQAQRAAGLVQTVSWDGRLVADVGALVTASSTAASVTVDESETEIVTQVGNGEGDVNELRRNFVDLELRYATDNWEAYVAELDRRGLGLGGGYQVAVDVAGGDAGVAAEVDVAIERGRLFGLVTDVLSRATTATALERTDGQDDSLEALLLAVQNGNVESLQFRFDLTDEHLTLEAGALFDEAFLEEIVTNAGGPGEFTLQEFSAESDGTESRDTLLLTGLDPTTAVATLRDAGVVDEETTIYPPGSFDPATVQRDTTAIRAFVDGESPTVYGTPAEGPAFGVLSVTGTPSEVPDLGEPEASAPTSLERTLAVGDPLSTTVWVYNPTTATVDTEVSLANGTDVLDAVPVTLTPGESTVLTLSAPTDAVAPGDYVYTVALGEETVDVPVTVTSELDVTVEVVSKPASIAVGTDVVVTVEVTSDEETTVTDVVELRDDDGTVRDSVAVEVEPGASERVDLRAPTDGLAAGTVVFTVVSTVTGVERAVPVVLSSATDVSVSVPAAPTRVTIGEELVVQVIVNNPTTEFVFETVRLELDGVVLDDRSVFVAPGGASELQLRSGTVGLSPGTSEFAVTGEEADTMSRFELTIDPATDPVPTVDLVATPDAATIGESFTVTLRVSNPTDRFLGESLRVQQDGRPFGFGFASVPPGDTVLVDVIVPTFGVDPGPTMYTVVTDSRAVPLSFAVTLESPVVDEPFSVSPDSPPVTLGVGQPFGVDLTVENVGDVERTETLTLAFDGSVADETELTLAPGEFGFVDLVADTTGLPPGAYDWRVTSDRGAIDGSVEIVAVDEPFAIELGDSPVEIIPPGDSFVVDLTVENVGGAERTETLTLAFDGSVADETELTLAPGALDRVDLVADTTGLPPGVYDWRVTGDDATVQGSVEIVAADEPFAVDVFAPGVVFPDEGFVVELDVENVGGVERTETLTLAFDGSVADETELTLAPGEFEFVDLVADTTGLPPGAYDWRVTGDGRVIDEGTVEVEPDDGGESDGVDVEVEVLSAPETVSPGEILVVEARVTNDGDDSIAEYATLELDTGTEFVVDAALVELPAGASTVVTLTADADRFPADATVVEVVVGDAVGDRVIEFVDDGTAPEAYSSFELELVSPADGSAVVTAGEEVAVTVEVSNPTGETDTQWLTLVREPIEVDDESAVPFRVVVDATEVTLASGESTELTLVADTSGLPSGLYGVDPYVGTSFELVDVDVEGDA